MQFSKNSRPLEILTSEIKWRLPFYFEIVISFRMHKWTSSEGCNNGNIPPSGECGSFYIFPSLGFISLANVSFFMNLRDSSKRKVFRNQTCTNIWVVEFSNEFRIFNLQFSIDDCLLGRVLLQISLLRNII